MPRRVSLVCDDDLLDRVDLVARKYDLSRQEVLLQAVEIGLETIEADRSQRRA